MSDGGGRLGSRETMENDGESIIRANPSANDPHRIAQIRRKGCSQSKDLLIFEHCWGRDIYCVDSCIVWWYNMVT